MIKVKENLSSNPFGKRQGEHLKEVGNTLSRTFFSFITLNVYVHKFIYIYTMQLYTILCRKIKKFKDLLLSFTYLVAVGFVLAFGQFLHLLDIGIFIYR